MASKYYSNPFEEDDDATCFADVEVVEVPMDASREREDGIPVLQMTSRPSLSSSALPRLEVHDEDYSRRDSGVSFHSVELSPYSESVNETSFPNFPLTQNKKSSGGHGGMGSPRTDRWKLEELNQKLSELQHTMKEMSSSKSLMEGDYEEHMESLRHNLNTCVEEKNELLSAKSKLESDLRTLRAEKDDLSFLYNQEKERNEILSKEVTQLQLELSVARDTHHKMLNELQQSHQDELNRTSHLNSPHGSDLLGSTSSGTVVGAGGFFSSVTTGRGSRTAEHGGEVDSRSSFQEKVEGVVTSQRPHEPTPAQQSVKVPASVPGAVVREVRSRGKGDPNVSSWSFGGNREVSHHPETKTEKEKNEEHKNRAQEIESLEAELRKHNQAREELNAQLTRLERSKVRCAGDRHKKSLVEDELEQEEKVIGHIRLKMRSLQAFAR